jgi:hypothetical protein
MTASNSPRATGRGKPEGEPRRDRRVQLRSIDAKLHLADISEEQAAELLRRHLCSDVRTASGKRLYLRLLISEEDLPRQPSIASLITVRHVQGPPTIQSDRGADYYEHCFPESVTIADRMRRQT